MKPESSARNGFTLIELLVVIAIIAILAGLLLPVLSSSQDAGRKAACLSNLRQIGIAIQSYASENEGRIPFGPKALPYTNPNSFYPSTGSPTSLLSLQSGDPVALGLLLRQYLSSQPRVLFCPGSDEPVDANAELAKVGMSQAQGSYYYRHAGNTSLFDTPSTVAFPAHIMLDNLGTNRNGFPIQALAIDSMFLCSTNLIAFNVKPRTHHRLKYADVLFSDGHVASRSNKDGRFTENLTADGDLHDSFDVILKVFEHADVEP